MRVYSKTELLEQAELLAQDHFCPLPAEIALESLHHLKPREQISTLHWSETKRKIRKPDGTKTEWLRALTPFLIPVMEAHDNPDVREIIVPKPSRCGGTVVAENFAMKCLDSGPTWDVMWYLAGPEEVRSYADRIVSVLFEDHLEGRVGTGRSDDNKTRKKVGTQSFELLVMSGKTTTNRQAAYIVFDEPDSYSKVYQSNFIEQGRQRQRQLGTDRKIYACAHPDVGWSGGIAQAWTLSTQGIFVMQCPSCGRHASPYPTKHWPDVPRFRIAYEMAPEGTPVDRRIALAGRTASILCPEGCVLDEAHRADMIDAGRYMHKGQVLDIDAGIIGEVESNETWGFWVHVLMSKQVGLSELARELEGAIEHKERTGKNDKLKQVLVRTFGEAFESEADLKGIDAAALRRRTNAIASADEGAVDFTMGQVPDGVRFIVASADPGHRKVDILLRGFDEHRRSWLIDRYTIRQRRHADGIMRDIDLVNVQDDWHVLDEVIDRLVPLQSKPGMAMPVAVLMIDSSDGNTTDKAYEFTRRASGRAYGAFKRVRCLKGVSGKRDHISLKPKWLSMDSQGKLLDPPISMHIAGVDGLKDDVLGNDAGVGFIHVDDGGPGQIYFPTDFPMAAYDEIFREPKVEGTYTRNGANETLDLLVYAECGRLLLKPDRAEIKWSTGSLPPWANPVPLKPKGGDLAVSATGETDAPAAPKTIFDRYKQLNPKPKASPDG